MGTRTNWVCTDASCGFEVRPVAGGFTRGFYARTQTRICLACRDVRDCTVGLVSDPTHRVFTADEHKGHENPDPACKACGGPTIPWDRSCPMCGARMERGTTRIMFD